jgi:non-specific serine/threonine protein kinase
MIPSSARVTFRFGDFELDTVAYELRRKGRRVRLTGQPMSLLLLLLQRPGELVSRDDIAKRLWSPEIFVDVDAGIRTAVLRIRQVLADSHASPRFVETVPGKGYRFVAPVKQVAAANPQTPPEFTQSVDNLPEPPRHNLPTELTSFVGRQQELEQLQSLLGSSRLLTLAGTGGVGKTRLALRLADAVVERFRDGVWMVDLAPVTDAGLVPHTVASAVGIREGSQRSMGEMLLHNLRSRQLLLVLDNCEHLVEACAELAESALRNAPALCIVATSREPLGVPGETIWRVASLSLPESSSHAMDDGLLGAEATRLFVERARSLDPGFAATEVTATTIARICRRLDGIPLAIELAAARIGVLSVEQIDTRLQNRFRLLTGGVRTAVPRQRTLEATMQWSYQLLAETERQLLERLSVFPAGFTLETTEEVCGGNGIAAADMLDLVSRLVTKSLVVLESVPAAARRYRLLETVRQYARERLIENGDLDRLRDTHFQCFFHKYRGAMPVLRGADQLHCLECLHVDRDDVRAALEWAIASPSFREQGLELAGALFWYWTKRGAFAEGRQWLERALEANPDAPATLRTPALIGLAHMLYFQGQFPGVGAVLVEALSLGRANDDGWAVSFALFMQGLLAFERGDRDEAVARSKEALDAADTCGHPVQLAGPLMVLANAALAEGNHDRAQRFYDQSIDVARRTGEIWSLGIILSVAAGLRIVRQDFASARAQASEAMSLNERLDDPRGIAWNLEVFAGLAAAEGDADTAARLWGASDRLLDSVGGSLLPHIKWIRDRYLEPVQAALGPEAFDAASATGRSMSSAKAVAFARRNLGWRGRIEPGC